MNISYSSEDDTPIYKRYMRTWEGTECLKHTGMPALRHNDIDPKTLEYLSFFRPNHYYCQTCLDEVNTFNGLKNKLDEKYSILKPGSIKRSMTSNVKLDKEL